MMSTEKLAFMLGAKDFSKPLEDAAINWGIVNGHDKSEVACAVVGGVRWLQAAHGRHWLQRNAAGAGVQEQERLDDAHGRATGGCGAEGSLQFHLRRKVGPKIWATSTLMMAGTIAVVASS